LFQVTASFVPSGWKPLAFLLSKVETRLNGCCSSLPYGLFHPIFLTPTKPDKLGNLSFLLPWCLTDFPPGAPPCWGVTWGVSSGKLLLPALPSFLKTQHRSVPLFPRTLRVSRLREGISSVGPANRFANGRHFFLQSPTASWFPPTFPLPPWPAVFRFHAHRGYLVQVIFRTNPRFEGASFSPYSLPPLFFSSFPLCCV